MGSREFDPIERAQPLPPIATGDAFERYAERIRLPDRARRGGRPTLELLSEIQLAHATAIPFENLDIHLGLPIRLEAERIFDKLVTRRRGGYCFEQNGLLLEMLRGLGFQVRPLAARVTYGAGLARPRTHMVLLVDVGARSYLVDAGFGTHNLLGPLAFERDETVAIHGEAFRLTEANEVQTRIEDRWESLYTVSLEEQHPADFVMASWFTSTHPSSLFVRSKIVSTVAIGKRTLLFDRELKIRSGASAETRTLEEDAAWLATLRDTFGIDLPDGALLRW